MSIFTNRSGLCNIPIDSLREWSLCCDFYLRRLVALLIFKPFMPPQSTQQTLLHSRRESPTAITNSILLAQNLHDEKKC